jgi:hypothetical protein
MVKILRIGQSAGKLLTPLMTRVWRNFNDQKVVGLRELVTLNEGLRYDLLPSESLGIPTHKLSESRFGNDET